MNRRATGRERGFTLISMMVVISIMLILLGVAMPIFSHSLTRAREENLRTNLETLNQAIFQYAQDKQKAPQSLSDLVSAKYLKTIPNDITGNPDTWETEPGEGVIMSLDQKDDGGIIGVHSGSTQVGSNGKAYSEW
ncbi:MAG: type II secretion system protein [Terriglobales bacterium]|jgi:general secretion pathway protein G